MGPVLALLGATLTLLSAIGVVRFPDVMARMHALTKASTVGVVLVLLGGAVTLDHPNDVTTLLLAAALQLLTLPVAANLMSRSTYMARGIASHVDEIDELADRHALDDADPGPVDDTPPSRARAEQNRDDAGG
ncbi:MAG TPA: monovalent cation/H(+) antiporter subunit G [Acidimicrobiales bacterium]|nr:monovalent cation/H(+) antiporter subunit G [Acidimicrobiales bacterium]